MKKLKNRIVLIAACFLAPGYGLFSQSTWNIIKPSSLTVVATSNVSSITCVNPAFTQKEPLIFTPDGSRTKIEGKIIMPVKDLGCGNFFYNTNMRKTLKADKHPNLQIRYFHTNEKLNLASPLDKQQLVKVEITLAGVTNIYDIPIRFQRTNAQLILSGASLFRLSDFKMEPTFMGKVVEVADEFVVKFNLILEENLR